jgi:hypothetical protein
MKRFVFLLVAMLVITGLPVFAEEAVLLDFSTIAADTDDGEHEATLVDFSETAGTGFTDEERLQMKSSIAIENWDVILASSSRTTTNQRYSLVRQVPVKDDAKQNAGSVVMGIRVHFPIDPFNSWARIEPPFEIPGYMQRTVLQSDGSLENDETDLKGSKFDGFGVVKNTGVIKSVSVTIYGSNYPNGFALVLKDQNNEEHEVFMGYLEFDGWRTLTWQNPNYIDDVRNREIKKYPLYPRSEPLTKLVGLQVYRDAMQEGGDFILYVKDITITYDKALLETDRDINEEEIWGILGEREDSRRQAEFRKLGNIQVLRYLEEKKMHKEE